MSKNKPFSDASVLPQEEQDAIRTKAREVVEKEIQDAASKRFLEQALAEERAKANISDKNEPLVSVQVDLPGHSQGLKINNHMYFHGHTYRVPVSVARDMKSMMARAWEHEAEVGGANRDSYRKPLNQTIRPGA